MLTMKKQLLILLVLPAMAFAQKKGEGIIVEQNNDSRLIGTWASDCLTPKADDPWSEKHTFVFYKNFTARHERISFSAPGCMGASNMNLVDNYKYVIEGKPNVGIGTGQIILKGPMGPMPDVYQINGNTLMFGHGFRNHQSYSIPLNTYIVYKKLSK